MSLKLAVDPQLRIHLSYEGAKLSLPSQQGFWAVLQLNAPDADEAIRWLISYATRKPAPLPTWVQSSYIAPVLVSRLQNSDSLDKAIKSFPKIGEPSFLQVTLKALLTIPFGQTVSYRELAETIGKPKAVQAVGAACGRNPMPLLIPCHRVVRSDGGFGGYNGGIELKKRLLAFEAALR